ncbi:MAG: GatB/YqeY domain-containing protein [candidate division Zixibacteria bacterium]|nr:GatB/YqeY domain-containing protein [candidate division Zixibacteria bacterium]
MSLPARIDEDIIKALKSGDKLKVTALRGLKSDIKYKRIEKGDDLTDDDIIGVLDSAAKRRRDSIEQFQAGNRADLVEKETAELAIITSYLPQQLTEEELRELILDSIKETGVDSPAKAGLVMKDLIPKIKGKANGRLVNNLVSQILSGGKS